MGEVAAVSRPCLVAMTTVTQATRDDRALLLGRHSGRHTWDFVEIIILHWMMINGITVIVNLKISSYAKYHQNSVLRRVIGKITLLST